MDESDSRRSAAVDTAHRLELRVRADPFWMAPLRALVSEAAARADLDLDQVADLTLAVDEACALVIRLLMPSETLLCRLDVTGEGIEATVRAMHPAAVVPFGVRVERTFGWHVLGALTDHVETLDDHGATFGVRLRTCRTAG